ncbi:MAG: hypothetical protein JNL32_14565 [Candidatus Kapabacteria bacterium]|nr:hypothetical protein [Candidatus Kapabacteria bacterium]
MMDFQDIRLLAKKLVDEMDAMHKADLAPKWENATMMIVPTDPNLKAHEMPVEKLLHKIVMMRDNMRVLEQQINSNDKLSDGEKVKLQSYITKCYGSMTSFNFLFYNDDDKF